MKSILSFLLALTCVLGHAYGQSEKISLGVKGGLNIASISNTGSASINIGSSGSSYKNKSKFLPHFGAYSEIKINDFLSLQPELLFSMKGYGSESKAKIGGTSEEVDNSLVLSYIDIPLQMRFNFGKGFSLITGPYFGFLVSAKSKSKTVATTGGTTTTVETESSDKDGYNTLDGGINVGVGYQMENGLNFGIRWNRGFGNIYDQDGSFVVVNHSNNVFQFSVGFDLAKF